MKYLPLLLLALLLSCDQASSNGQDEAHARLAEMITESTKRSGS